LFGALPTLEDTTMSHASPIGNEAHRRAWKEIPVRTRRAISEAFANVGKAIAAFESTLDFEVTRFDRYVDEPTASGILSDAEVAGLRLFLDPKNQCLKCHNGPTFTNGGFHNVGTGSSDPDEPDLGRIAGLQAVLLDEFNCQGRYSDAREGCDELAHLAPEAHLAGAFKVPSLRGVARTPPYMHDGRFATLREVLEFYRSPAPRDGAMPHELTALPHLSDADLANLEAFLETLSP
jgi:cytochrome c peroxidase